MTIPTVKDLDVKGKRVLVRVDFNVPMDETGMITDDTRIRLAIPTIKLLLERGAKVILMSHLRRPKGETNPKFSLRSCADALSTLLEKEVSFAPDCIGEEVENLVEKMEEGEVLLLENLRFHAGEEHPEKDPQFAKELSSLGDLYVNDAFSAAHRKHSSTTVIAKYFPGKRAIGLLMEKEISFLSTLVENPKRPFYAIVGGGKVGSKLGALNSLVKKIDGIFIGGGMAFTFLKAKGIPIGDSICDDLEVAKIFLNECKKNGVEVHLPSDLVITDSQEIKIVSTEAGIPSGSRGMDVGPKTVEEWTLLLQKGGTIFWNGPMGVFEEKAFSHGTNRLAQNLSIMDVVVIVGGGDSIAAINGLGLENNFTHLSSGGGALLEFIEHGTLPGIDVVK